MALVEDDQPLARAVMTGSRDEGYRVRAAWPHARGRELSRERNPDPAPAGLSHPTVGRRPGGEDATP